MKFPKNMYVKVEDEDKDGVWFNASPDPEKLADTNMGVAAGLYKLVRVVTIANDTRVLTQEK